ncbi:MAG: protein-glutamate O-methyltransferase CheR [Polyangiaceae bacterium]|nr:protein-glutamate O-methyltransferase CheR [Polyangiaceae bacterium]
METVDFQFLQRFMHSHAAIVIDEGKQYLVENRLQPVAKAAGLADLHGLVARLKGEPFGHLHRDVLDAMTTNETSFFRDTKLYEALEREILPELLTYTAGRKLTIWCAACSTGQEPYTLSIIFKEKLRVGPERVEIIATDICERALAAATLGEYSQMDVNRGLPAPLLLRNFQQAGRTFRINDEVKKYVKFRKLNLAQAWEGLGSLDLVLIRNVLIYFNIDTKRQILNRVKSLMKPHAYLILGAAETTLNIDDSYERIVKKDATIYRPVR